MRLNIVSIVLDGEPYIERHLPVFQSLSTPWTWHVREGAAANTHCTRWCRRQKPRLSLDGTHEYLQSISLAGNVEYYGQSWWDGKIEMFNDVVKHIDEPGILMEIDADEIWTKEQLEKIVRLFDDNPQADWMRFYCRYWVGPHKLLLSKQGYGNRGTEWVRAWRFRPGMKFNSHEPPVLDGNKGNCLDREFTKHHGLVFSHYAYCTPQQLEYKQAFYGYSKALDEWERFQKNKKWPVDVSQFLHWIEPGIIGDDVSTIPSHPVSQSDRNRLESISFFLCERHTDWPSGI